MAATAPRHHPAVARELARAEDAQVRIADLITSFAGSMPFVYVHVALFAAWMLLYERSPWPSLTLVVSLEAIFLSTFVMIGQNRQARFQRTKADHDFLSEEQELRLNTEMTRTIEQLVRQIHETVRDQETPTAPASMRQAWQHELHEARCTCDSIRSS